MIYLTRVTLITTLLAAPENCVELIKNSGALDADLYSNFVSENTHEIFDNYPCSEPPFKGDNGAKIWKCDNIEEKENCGGDCSWRGDPSGRYGKCEISRTKEQTLIECAMGKEVNCAYCVDNTWCQDPKDPSVGQCKLENGICLPKEKENTTNPPPVTTENPDEENSTPTPGNENENTPPPPVTTENPDEENSTPGTPGNENEKTPNPAVTTENPDEANSTPGNENENTTNPPPVTTENPDEENSTPTPGNENDPSTQPSDESITDDCDDKDALIKELQEKIDNLTNTCDCSEVPPPPPLTDGEGPIERPCVNPKVGTKTDDPVPPPPPTPLTKTTNPSETVPTSEEGIDGTTPNPSSPSEEGIDGTTPKPSSPSEEGIDGTTPIPSSPIITEEQSTPEPQGEVTTMMMMKKKVSKCPTKDCNGKTECHLTIDESGTQREECIACAEGYSGENCEIQPDTEESNKERFLCMGLGFNTCGECDPDWCKMIKHEDNDQCSWKGYAQLRPFGGECGYKNEEPETPDEELTKDPCEKFGGNKKCQEEGKTCKPSTIYSYECVGTEVEQTIPSTDEGLEEEKTTPLPTNPLTQEEKETPPPLTTTISTTTTATRKSTTLTRKSTTLPPAGTEIQGQTIPTTDEGKEEEAGKTTSLPTEPLTQERKETPAPLITLPQPSEQTQPTVEEGREEEGEPCGYVKVLTTIMGKKNNFITDECRAILLPNDTPTPLPHGGVCKTTCKGEKDPNHTASLKCDNGTIIYEALDCPPRTARSFGHGSYR